MRPWRPRGKMTIASPEGPNGLVVGEIFRKTHLNGVLRPWHYSSRARPLFLPTRAPISFAWSTVNQRHISPPSCCTMLLDIIVVACQSEPFFAHPAPPYAVSSSMDVAGVAGAVPTPFQKTSRTHINRLLGRTIFPQSCRSTARILLIISYHDSAPAVDRDCRACRHVVPCMEWWKSR